MSRASELSAFSGLLPVCAGKLENWLGERAYHRFRRGLRFSRMDPCRYEMYHVGTFRVRHTIADPSLLFTVPLCCVDISTHRCGRCG